MLTQTPFCFFGNNNRRIGFNFCSLIVQKYNKMGLTSYKSKSVNIGCIVLHREVSNNWGHKKEKTIKTTRE